MGTSWGRAMDLGHAGTVLLACLADGFAAGRLQRGRVLVLEDVASREGRETIEALQTEHKDVRVYGNFELIET